MVTTRERLLDVAAKELGEHGYAGASLNRILAQAGVSKSSAYHHFSDKADLAVTVLERYWNVIETDKYFERAVVSAESFWPTLLEMHAHQLDLAKDAPWMWSTLRCSRDIMMSMPADNPAIKRIEPMLRALFDLFEGGRKLGVVRRDLPDSLLTSLMFAFDGAADSWLADHGKTLSRAKLRAIGAALQQMMFTIMAPMELQNGKRTQTTRRVASTRSVPRIPKPRRSGKSSGVAR